MLISLKVFINKVLKISLDLMLLFPLRKHCQGFTIAVFTGKYLIPLGQPIRVIGGRQELNILWGAACCIQLTTLLIVSKLSQNCWFQNTSLKKYAESSCLSTSILSAKMVIGSIIIHSLKSWGKVYIVVFLTHWCPIGSTYQALLEDN